MTTKMSGNPRASRLAAVLLHFSGATAPVTARSLAEATGWDMATASRSLSNAKQFGYVVVGKKVGFGKDEHALTQQGHEKLAAFQPGYEPAGKVKSLGERALELIDKSVPGVNSGDLADQLETTADAVEEALGLHVLSKRLTSCAIKNALGEFVHYRVSAGLAQASIGNDVWKKQPVTSLPPPAPKAPAKKAAREVASEVVAPVAPKPAAAPVPFVGELDIDAIHRAAPKETSGTDYARVQAAEAPPAAPPPCERCGAIKPTVEPITFPSPADSWGKVTYPPEALSIVEGDVDEEEEFLCALFSDGSLVMQAGEVKFALNVGHTRQLLHYLDHIRADLITEEAAS